MTRRETKGPGFNFKDWDSLCPRQSLRYGSGQRRRPNARQPRRTQRHYHAGSYSCTIQGDSTVSRITLFCVNYITWRYQFYKVEYFHEVYTLILSGPPQLSNNAIGNVADFLQWMLRDHKNRSVALHKKDMTKNPLITIQKFPQTKLRLQVLLHATHDFHIEVSKEVIYIW